MKKEEKVKESVVRRTRRKHIGKKGSKKADVEENEEELSSDSPTIETMTQSLRTPAKFVNWQIIKQGNNRAAYKIIRKDYTKNLYLNFPAMLQDLTRDDLKELYTLMVTKHGDVTPEDDFKRVLWGDLKIMFDPPSKADDVWKLPHQQEVRY